MLAPRIRNTVVGITVIGSLVSLAWLIFQFGDAPAALLKGPQIRVSFIADRGDGLGQGGSVNYLGIQVGRVLSVRREVTTLRDSRSERIVIQTELDKNPPIPANVSAEIVITSPLGGVSSLDLRLPPGTEPDGVLSDGAELKARYLGSTFLPPEFAELARDMSATVRQFNDAKVIDSLRNTVELAGKRIDQAGAAIDGFSSLVNDPKLREDIKSAIASIRQASDDAKAVAEQAKALMARGDATVDKVQTTLDNTNAAVIEYRKQAETLGGKVYDQLTRLGQVLDDVRAITAKVERGEGTAGMLMNDAKLYQSLVDSSRELSLAVGDVRRLIQQWEQEGITLKLGR
jgi:phospholipid/cholesterol/gamma-HCH transport system substrate-binding protein